MVCRAFFAWAMCVSDNKYQVIISAIIKIKQDDVIRRWDWKGRRWPLLDESSFTYQIDFRRKLIYGVLNILTLIANF